MKRYYIRGHYSDWKEVSKQQYEEYIKFIKEHATNMEKFDDAIKRRTKIIEN